MQLPTTNAPYLPCNDRFLPYRGTLVGSCSCYGLRRMIRSGHSDNRSGGCHSQTRGLPRPTHTRALDDSQSI